MRMTPKERRLARQMALMDVFEFFGEELAYGTMPTILEARMRVLRERVFNAMEKPTVTDLMRMKKECQ